jgi:hypothetical protein
MPPADVAALVDAPASPSVSISPTGATLLIATQPGVPTIADLAQPVVTINAPAAVDIGQTVNVTVSFDNQGTGPGFGPWIDVFIDRTGADGIVNPADPSNPNIGDTNGIGPGDFYDGFELTSNPQFLGLNLNHQLITLNDAANGGLGVLHPYAVDSTGAPVYISTTNVASPYFSVLNGNFGTGDQVLVIELPFGSFVEDQPPADVNFGLTLSDHADLNTPLNITALGGFRFGDDEFFNPAVDPSIIGVPDATQIAVTTTVVRTRDGGSASVLSGPDVPWERIDHPPVGPAADVLARVLGVTPAPNDGDPNVVKRLLR